MIGEFLGVANVTLNSFLDMYKEEPPLGDTNEHKMVTSVLGKKFTTFVDHKLTYSLQVFASTFPLRIWVASSSWKIPSASPSLRTSWSTSALIQCLLASFWKECHSCSCSTWSFWIKACESSTQVQMESSTSSAAFRLTNRTRYTHWRWSSWFSSWNR